MRSVRNKKDLFLVHYMKVDWPLNMISLSLFSLTPT